MVKKKIIPLILCIFHKAIQTCADHSSILRMVTVMATETSVVTLIQGIFASGAVDIVQPDLAAALAKVRSMGSSQCLSTAHLPADHLGIIEVPAVIAHAAPGTSELDLHSAGALPAPPDQPNRCGVHTEF